MSDAIIDQTVFEDLQAAAGEDFVVELVDTFLAEAPQMLDDLRAALAAGDADGFRRAAHSLKSNATTFGANALADASRELELGDLPGDDDVLGAIKQQFDDAAAALTSLVHG